MKIIFIIFAFIISVNASRKFARIERCEMCNMTQDTPITLQNITLRNIEGEASLISLTVVISRDFRTTFEFEAKIIRCLNKEALDTCVPFTTLKPFDSCALLNVKHMAWTKLVDGFKPAISCPLKKGNYVLTNATLDSNLFKFFPTDNYYWRSRLTYAEGKEFMTLCFDLKVIKSIN